MSRQRLGPRQSAVVDRNGSNACAAKAPYKRRSQMPCPIDNNLCHYCFQNRLRSRTKITFAFLASFQNLSGHHPFSNRTGCEPITRATTSALAK